MIAPGTRLGRYTVRQPLGAGGMGEVYLAFDPELERQVALKVLPSDLAADSGRVARFVREAKAASALNHPNILTVYDAGIHEDVRFLVTEYVEGRTLRRWLEQGPPELSRVLEVVAQAASALAVAHEAGIVHRDVKPENLMLRRDGLVKVLDFGIAKLTAAPSLDTGASTAAQATQPGAVVGTVRYMSPEQATGAAVDARTDVWSLGVVLYELVAGAPPFARASPVATLAAILERDPEPLERAAPHAPASLSRLLERALRKRPEERTASAAELAAELRRIARELERGATPESEAQTAAFPAIAPVAEAAAVAAQMPPTNLPAHLPAIVGREREVEEVASLLRAPGGRLVTLTGPGGTGKTRLALEVARGLLSECRDGVFAVDLSQLTDPALVPAQVAQALGVAEAAGSPIGARLARHLGGRATLLVLDSFEHLLAASPLVAELLGAAPELRVLATSRAPLHLRQEREYAVDPLEVPSFATLPPLEELGRSGAVALFVERTREARPSFALTAENARAVVEICRRLDGLPLAIELAAAWVKMLAPAALLGKLDQRLKLLTGGARDLPERQQTMRAAVQWSYDLLEAGERELLCRLAVFAGGFDYEAAEAVCGAAGLDVLDGLRALVDKSLLRQREREDGETRFLMLDLIREFALEQLNESGWAEAAGGEHARYFLRLAEEARPELSGPEQAVHMARLAREHENLRAALSYLIERSSAEGARLAAALRGYWDHRAQYTEARGWFERFLATEAAPHVRAQLLVASAQVLHGLGNLAGSTSRAREALALARELGDALMVYSALTSLGIVAAIESRLEEARASFEEALSVSQAHGLPVGILTNSLVNLGYLAAEQKDYAGAVRYCEQVIELHGRDACMHSVAIALMNLAECRFELGDVDEARACFREAVAKARQLGNTHFCAFGLDKLAAVAVEDGRPERAAALWGAAEAQYEATSAALTPSAAAFRARYVEKLRSALEPEPLERARARGRAMGLEAAVAEALQ